MELTDYVGLDFETYASTDLPLHGLQRYVNCPDFRPLLAAVVWNDNENLSGFEGVIIDFVEDHEEGKRQLLAALKDSTIVAHNAGFEQSVLAAMGIDIPSSRFVDSAVLARAAGAAGKLEAAAPQLLGMDKLESGWELIKLFSIPGEYQRSSSAFDPRIRTDHLDKWAEFAHYCAVDAEISLRLAGEFLPYTSHNEIVNNAITMDMNNVGWKVDLDLVRNMQLRYLTNVANAEAEFRKECDAEDLNLNSSTQLKEWCAERGIRAMSFDEAHVEKLLKSIQAKLDKGVADPDKAAKYLDVRQLLWTKQILGGSSLKKLQTILDTTGTDGRLHDQYLHCGAGATFRTTGRGVQMQNLKRLNGEGDDMTQLWLDDTDWDNSQLAANLRQVFTATKEDGFLIVGDFSSVESRGLAWQAGEQWKLDAYAQGRGVYEELAARKFSKPVEQITKPERTFGKVGELSCGYQAGPSAVRDFAAKMGVELSELESAQLVSDWRTACPKTVDYWARLHQALLDVVTLGLPEFVHMPEGNVTISPVPAPESLREQTGNQELLSLRIKMHLFNGTRLLERVIHGTHIKGRNIHYWKPSERKTGDLWTETWTNPKTKRQEPFTIYGGKLAGLLTQSLCREVFFDSLREIHTQVAAMPNVELVGQFHDEVVLDWVPGPVSFNDTVAMLQECMSRTILPGFPLAAEIKSDYRYTK